MMERRCEDIHTRYEAIPAAQLLRAFNTDSVAIVVAIVVIFNDANRPASIVVATNSPHLSSTTSQ